MLRAGALSVDDLRKVVPVIDLPAASGGAEPELSPADRRAAEAIAAANAANAANAVNDGKPDDPADNPEPGD
jgi:hypothetical protein